MRLFLSRIQLNGLHRISLALELWDLAVETQLTGHLTCRHNTVSINAVIVSLNMDLSVLIVNRKSVATNRRGE